MCIYCGTKNYRKIYENHHGPIPKDSEGRSYHIHHIDGNHHNNHIDNLVAVSIREHYQIHFDQGDWGACIKLAATLSLSLEELADIRLKVGQINKLHQQKLVEEGKHHWLGGQKQTARNHQWVAEGRHPFLGGDLQRKRVKEGTHPFLGGKIQREATRKSLAEGRHNSQIKLECPHCGTVASLPNSKKYHFDRCKKQKNQSPSFLS